MAGSCMRTPTPRMCAANRPIGLTAARFKSRNLAVWDEGREREREKEVEKKREGGEKEEIES